MRSGADVDGVLVQWGDRLFYPGNRIVRSPAAPNLHGSVGRRAAAIRGHIRAAIRRAPQVMVKVTGGGRGMRRIVAHFAYISRNGSLEVEDDRGLIREGKEALHDLAEQWRYGGSFIDQTSHRREALNITLSMPRGVDALTVQRAAREFAQTELHEHRYVMVLHDDQANPHVHISVRAESMHGERLNPRKADLQRWRETFAERLRGWGVEAEATRQTARGQVRRYDPIGRVKAREEGRLKTRFALERTNKAFVADSEQAVDAWEQLIAGLGQSERADDRELAAKAEKFLRSTPFARRDVRQRELIADRPPQTRDLREVQHVVSRNRSGPEITR
jgi:hypothetical protein